MPLFHIHGLVAALLVVALRRRERHLHARLPRARRSTAGSRARADLVHGGADDAPGRARAQARPGRGPRSLRFVRSSSAPLPPQSTTELEEAFGVPVIEAYGMTEAAHQIASNPLPPGARKPGSVGLPTGVEIAVLDEDGVPVPAGEVGEVAIKGPTVFAGYESNPEANAECVRRRLVPHRRRGLARRGRLPLPARAHQGDHQPRRREGRARGGRGGAARASGCRPGRGLRRPGHAAGRGRRRRRRARRGRSVTEHELQEHVASRLADFKVPRDRRDRRRDSQGARPERFSASASRNGSGIVDAARTSRAAGVRRSAHATRARAGELWAEMLDVERVGVDDDFFALGGDSILAAELSARIAERNGRVPPLTTLMWAPTLGAFCAAGRGRELGRRLAHRAGAARAAAGRRCS